MNFSPEMKTTVSLFWPLGLAANLAGIARLFDIVNGFLIDAVAHGFDLWIETMCYIQMCNLAEIIVRTEAAG